MNAISSPKEGINIDAAWREVVVLFRRVCFLRRMGRADESNEIMRKELPGKIARWSKAVPEPSYNKRLRLEHMFQEEQRRVADACTLHELSLVKWQQDMIPLLTEKISREVRTIVTSQLEQQAARQQEMGQKIQNLSGQFEEEAAKRIQQESLIQTVQKTVEQAVKKLPPAPVRIPFGDITAIIDMINDEERRIPTARKKYGVHTPGPGNAAAPAPTGKISINALTVNAAVA